MNRELPDEVLRGQMLPPTMEEVQSATDTRSGSMPAWRAKLKQMADMKKGAAPPAPRPATMADTPKNNRPRSQPAPRQE